MATTISLSGIQEMMKMQTGRVFTYLLEINHATLTNSFNFIADNADLEFDSKTWKAKAFEATLPSDKNSEIPIMTISFDNIEQELINLFRSVTGSITARFGIIALSGGSDPVLEKGFLDFEVTQIKYNESIVTIYLSYEKDYLNDPAVKDYFNPSTFPGLFS